MYKKSLYNESLFFKIEEISKYIQEDYISKYNDKISHDEFRVLDIINHNPNICQRDLAKLALRDCVKVGRILHSLEKKGYIERFNDTKGKRLVKKMKLTENGLNFYKEMINKIEPETQKFLNQVFTNAELKKVNEYLSKLNKALASTVKLEV